MQRECAIAEDFWRETLQPIEEKLSRDYKQTFVLDFKQFNFELNVSLFLNLTHKKINFKRIFENFYSNDFDKQEIKYALIDQVYK